MEINQLEHFKCLLEKGKPLDALLPLFLYVKKANLIENFSDTESTNKAQNLLNIAFENCGSDYLTTRKKLCDIIRKTRDRDQLDCALWVLFLFGDYSTLLESRNFLTKFPELDFYSGFSDYVASLLSLAHSVSRQPYLGKTPVGNTQFETRMASGRVCFSRTPKNNDVPLINNGRKIDLGRSMFSVNYDEVTESIILSDTSQDKVIAVDRKSLKIIHELKCPEPGVRGLAIHPILRRGFVNSEFGNSMFSFDLDNFKIRKRITGFSIRPERIRIDLKTDTLVTGNLGLYRMLPSEDIHYVQRWKSSSEDKVSDGKTLTVVNAITEKVEKTLPVGRRPTAVGISENYIVGGNFCDNTVHIFQRNTLDKPPCVGKVQVFPDVNFNFSLQDKISGAQVLVPLNLRAIMVEGIAIVEKRNWLLVAGFEGSILSIIDLTTGLIVDAIPVREGPMDVIINPQATLAFVSCHEAGEVSVVCLNKLREICRLQVGPKPMDPWLSNGMLITPHGEGFTMYTNNELEFLRDI